MNGLIFFFILFYYFIRNRKVVQISLRNNHFWFAREQDTRTRDFQLFLLSWDFPFHQDRFCELKRRSNKWTGRSTAQIQTQFSWSINKAYWLNLGHFPTYTCFNSPKRLHLSLLSCQIAFWSENPRIAQRSGTLPPISSIAPFPNPTRLCPDVALKLEMRQFNLYVY